MSIFNHTSKIPYDPNLQQPVLHSSICTGETVAGFKNIENGQFEEVMLIKDRRDLTEFIKLYNLKDENIKKEY